MVYGIKNIIDDLKCIWMSTNNVGDKLCDKNFECDNCEFDKQMKRSGGYANVKEFYTNPDYNLLDETIQKLNTLKIISYPSNYRFNNSFILKKFLGETYFMGFSPVLNVLFDNVSSTEIFGSGTRYLKGDDIFNIIGDWGSVVIQAPFDFSFESEILPVKASLNGKWIGFIKSDENKISPACVNREQYLKSIDSVCRHLKKYMDKFVTVGTTMYDGGERLKYIYQIIGKENYLKILMILLS
jgi:hypothetical protein